MRNKLNPHDYETRLHNSIIRYEGFPAYCQVDKDEGLFRLSPVHPGSTFKNVRVKPDDPKLDISTPELGWMNFKYDGFNCARHIVRMALRRWRQGLCETNTKCRYIQGSTLRGWPGRGYMNTQGFEDMIMGRYPTLDVALAQLTDLDTIEVAISREVCISKQDKIYKIFFHTEEVGWMNPNKKVVRVPHMDNAMIISKFLKGFPWEID